MYTMSDEHIALVLDAEDGEYTWIIDGDRVGTYPVPPHRDPGAYAEEIWDERDLMLSAVLWRAAGEDDIAVALHTRDVTYADDDCNSYLLTYGHVPEGGITHMRHWRLDCYPPDSPCGRLVSSSGRPDGYAEAVEWARRQVERVEMQ